MIWNPLVLSYLKKYPCRTNFQPHEEGGIYSKGCGETFHYSYFPHPSSIYAPFGKSACEFASQNNRNTSFLVSGKMWHFSRASKIAVWGENDEWSIFSPCCLENIHHSRFFRATSFRRYKTENVKTTSFVNFTVLTYSVNSYCLIDFEKDKILLQPDRKFLISCLDIWGKLKNNQEILLEKCHVQIVQKLFDL